MKLALILGTRPEIIKTSPLIRACEIKKIPYFILHTGQHYSYAMDKQFFNDLELPTPRYNLKLGNMPYHQQISRMIHDIAKILEKEMPTTVIVQGDTNTVLAGALAANKLGVRILHHEAGLRSYDLKMPEEINRTLTDHISDALCAPTLRAVKNLRSEGINKEKITFTGNTIVDALQQNLSLANKKRKILQQFGLKNKQYLVATTHRAENVDDKERLEKILQGLEFVSADRQLPIIYPLHPRTKKNISKFKLKIPKGVVVTRPLGYLDFLQLEANASLIITDSGGIQEEACALQVPCVTIRDTTERPETLRPGINVLAGIKPKNILSAVKSIMSVKKTKWIKPFGDGTAAFKILATLKHASD